VLQSLRNLVSPFHISLPLLISRTLFVLLCAAAPNRRQPKFSAQR